MITRSLKAALCVVALIVLVAATPGSAAEPAAEAKPENPLAKLPSKAEGAHIDKLKALGDNAWVILGQAAADPKWPKEGVARGRAFSPRMPYAPDLGGAFFCGTGVHGAKRSDGRYMDDLWFYDANTHRWICLYPGADPKTLKLHLDKNGFEVNDAGEHIPVSYLSHAYNNTTYNSDLRLYHIMWTQCPWWGKALPQRWEWLDQSDPGVAKRDYGNVGKIIPLTKHPLFWDVAQGRWDRKFVEGAGPGGRFEGVAEYVPSLKKTVYLHAGTTWLYDYAANAWTAGPKVPASVKEYDSNGCLDPKRERIWVAKGKGFAYYDVKASKWEDVKAEGQPDNLGCTSDAQLYFDAANGVLLWHKSHGPMVVFDPEANKWTDLGNSAPDVSGKRMGMKYMGWHGFYSPAFNAHFFYLAGDSSNSDATMLAYRYRRVKDEKAEKGN